MKKSLLVAVAILAMFAIALPANAQGKMAAGIGAEALIPSGNMGDYYSIGFGGMACFEYEVLPQLTLGGEAGYLTWSPKSDVSSDYKFHTIPIRVYGKYYFMPKGSLRVYGMVGLGMSFYTQDLPSETVAGVTVGGVTYGGGTYGGGSESGSNFNIYPGVGLTAPIGKTTDLDFNVKYDVITASGGSFSNIAFHLGVLFQI